MEFYTTRGSGTSVSAAGAICKGLAPDGGLFVPAAFPALSLEQALAQPDYPSLAALVLNDRWSIVAVFVEGSSW